MDDLTSELNEVGQVVCDLAARVRVASAMSQDNIIATKTNVDLAIQLCRRLEEWLTKIKENGYDTNESHLR